MTYSWAELLDPNTPVNYSDIRGEIARGCKDILAGLEPGEHLSTTELVDRLWPERYCKPEDRDKRKRLFTWLCNTQHMILEGWRRRGPEKRITRGMLKGKTAQPWEWFNGDRRIIICPNCGCERKV